MKKFFVIFASQAASMFGSSICGFALAWYMAKQTGSATILATAMMVSLIPAVVMGPFIGPFIDRWNRKKIMIYGDLVTALLTLVLVILFWTNAIQIWHIYVINACRSISGSFQWPALSASIPMIVPEKHLARTNGLNQMLNGIINLIAPPAGAFLMEAIDIQWVLSVDVITAAIAIGCLLPLAIPQPPRTTLSAKPNFFGDMVQSFRYIASWRGLLFMFILFSLINFFSVPLIALMPIYVTDHLNSEVLRLGWLQTAFGVGIITGGLILGVWGGFKRRVFTSFIFLLIGSAAIIGFSFTTINTYWMGLAMLAVFGVTNAFVNGPLIAVLQSVIARDVQGRIFALLGSISQGMIPLGLAVAGPLADAIGVRTVFLIGGIAPLVLALVAFTSRDLMNLENHKPEEQLIKN
jgi:DHA3 family macrolide efflux protein-like MFS transporter